jgi:hypothetical protein
LFGQQDVIHAQPGGQSAQVSQIWFSQMKSVSLQNVGLPGSVVCKQLQSARPPHATKPLQISPFSQLSTGHPGDWAKAGTRMLMRTGAVHEMAAPAPMRRRMVRLET